MCIRKIPLHPWCDCTDTDSLADGGPSCPHHVYIDRERLYQVCRSPSPPWDDQFDSILDARRYPAAEWVHCDTYIASWTINGVLHDGWEMRCPETMAKMNANHPKGYKEYYGWDGLCAQCDQGQGIPLRLVKVSQLHPEEDPVIDPLTGSTLYLPFDLPRLVELGGPEVDEDIVDIVMNQRPEASQCEPIFVHVTDDLDKSGIFLLPREICVDVREPREQPQGSLRSPALLVLGTFFPCFFFGLEFAAEDAPKTDSIQVF